MKDLYNNIKEVLNLAPAVQTASVNAVGVDHQGFDAVDHNIQLGESGDTLSGSVYIELILEESEDNSAWSPVTDNNCVLGPAVDSNGVFALIDDPAEDAQNYTIGYRGIKRYTRVRLAFTGTHTNGIPVSSLAVLGRAEYASTR